MNIEEKTTKGMACVLIVSNSMARVNDANLALFHTYKPTLPTELAGRKKLINWLKNVS
jgi:hypothetical protein